MDKSLHIAYVKDRRYLSCTLGKHSTSLLPLMKKASTYLKIRRIEYPLIMTGCVNALIQRAVPRKMYKTEKEPDVAVKVLQKLSQS